MRPHALAFALCALASARAAHAEDDLAKLHSESIHTRRLLADAVLVDGLVGLAAGGALIIPDAHDGAWRYAGINTAVFGAINTVIGIRALVGIAREEREWSAIDRSTVEGRHRAALRAAEDERRESVGHAVNLGLDCGYIGIGTVAIIASRAGADHPNRWLASGVAIIVQSVFLVAIDLIGLQNSHRYHGKFVESITPAVAVNRTTFGTETFFGVRVVTL